MSYTHYLIRVTIFTLLGGSSFLLTNAGEVSDVKIIITYPTTTPESLNEGQEIRVKGQIVEKNENLNPVHDRTPVHLCFGNKVFGSSMSEVDGSFTVSGPVPNIVSGATTSVFASNWDIAVRSDRTDRYGVGYGQVAGKRPKIYNTELSDPHEPSHHPTPTPHPTQTPHPTPTPHPTQTPRPKK